MANHWKIEDRIEPTLQGDMPVEHISFLRGPKPAPVGLYARAATLALVLMYLGFALGFAVTNGRSYPELVGVGLGCLAAVMIPVWISGWWDENKNQRTRYKVAAWAAAILLAVQVVGFVSLRESWQQLVQGKPLTSEELEKRAHRCERGGDLACAEDSWSQYVKRSQDDGRAFAMLGMIKSRRDDHAGAIEQFEKAIAQGTGAYDLFAYYAASLAKVGRTDDAIEWYYGALAAVPSLVDVRASLAKLLVNKSRHYEALALLQAFDSQREASGRPAYFTGQRIAIEKSIGEQVRDHAHGESLRLSAYGGHFFAPVTLGKARPMPFMVDTGATLTSLNQDMLLDSSVSFRTVDSDARMITADGRRVPAEVVVLASIQVGPHRLTNVKAVVCKDCVPLLGASVLSKFNMQSSKVRGSEFLTLAPRP
ncbi:MAG TPA: aspartyl protease family protein [Ramlibacter sp.]|nr:aspartyl protease family protein [Ramlibacter sp.]